MTHLELVPNPPAEDVDESAELETVGDRLWDIHAMVVDGHVEAAALRLAASAVELADVPLPNLRR